VGCGTGRLLCDFLNLGAHPANLNGVDLSESRIQSARQLLSSAATLQVIDGDSLPYSDESFDLVAQSVVFSSIHSQQLREDLAKEMRRVLKPGGYVIWWDLPYLVDLDTKPSLSPKDLFPDWPLAARRVGWLPRPGDVIARRHWRLAVGWIVNTLGVRSTHIAALIGPKPAPSKGVRD
jgi:ubiquinone/menaquinone biosynthesis C-methylase UbiE